jgi:predicted ABC-type transport system involved in lysophospholipase L1 biosynthesis ATPase subunit
VSNENKALFLVTHQQDLADRCAHQYVLQRGTLEPRNTTTP